MHLRFTWNQSKANV